MSTKEAYERVMEEVDAELGAMQADDIRQHVATLEAARDMRRSHINMLKTRLAALVEENHELREQLKRVPRDVHDAYAQGVEAPAEHIAKLEGEREEMLTAIRAAYEHLDRFGVVVGDERETESQARIFDLLRPFLQRAK